jgi:penicillin-binding protein 1A
MDTGIEAPQAQAVGSTSEMNKSQQDIQLPADNSRKLTGSTVAEVQRMTGPNTVQGPKCNIQACENAYRSFDAANCTYQPAYGPRRVCRK